MTSSSCDQALSYGHNCLMSLTLLLWLALDIAILLDGNFLRKTVTAAAVQHGLTRYSV